MIAFEIALVAVLWLAAGILVTRIFRRSDEDGQ